MYKYSFILGVIAGVAVLTSPMRTFGNAEMFPPAPDARSAIDFDNHGFLIHGQRTFIVSGSMHYARVPHELWRDRLMRFKRAGFNTVQTYVFWNYSEPREGEFAFNGDGDLDAFLKLVNHLGMYATVRIGPYVCAEWDSGGYPVWLRFKPNILLRQPNAAFEAAIDPYLDRVLGIVAANQISRGGSVIMLQVENEHPKGWGTDMPNAYFTHLRDKTVFAGIVIPWFFSGLHHGADPGNSLPWDINLHHSPWYTTEFWPGWYDDYGPLSANGLRSFDRGTWKIIANGGNGYNYYMLHGGSNFGYWNDGEDSASYDYGAAIGQAGDLRPIYYRFKRAAWFARSFQSVLEDSGNASAAYQGVDSDTRLHITARKGAAGTLVFLNNPTNQPIETQVKDPQGALYPSAGPFAVEAGEIMPIVEDYALTPGVKLEMAPRVLGIVRQNDRTTLVIYGPAGDPFEVRLANDNSGATASAADAGRVEISGTFSNAAAAEYKVNVGSHPIRILAMNSDLADRTWFIDEADGTHVISGPDYIGEVGAGQNAAGPHAETYVIPRATPIPGSYTDFTPSGAVAINPPDRPSAASYTAPALTPWQMHPAAAESAPSFPDITWTASPQPVQMGADGDSSCYAWYRAVFQAPQSGRYLIHFANFADFITVFLNGRLVGRADTSHSHAASLDVELGSGANQLAVFASHRGRSKYFSYTGEFNHVDSKGIFGPVTLYPADAPAVALSGWECRLLTSVTTELSKDLTGGRDSQDAGWQTCDPLHDVLHKQKALALFRCTVDATELPGSTPTLWMKGGQGDATIYVNGVKSGTQHSGDTLPLSLQGAWSTSGTNTIAILVNPYYGKASLGPDELRGGQSIEVTGWKIHGGEIPPAQNDAASWGAVADSGHAPAWYQAEFTAAPPAETGPHPILRLSTHGLSRGSVFLNGHNLGRYPEHIKVDGVYLPEPWIVAGTNHIVIFDEEGASPAPAHLVVEAAASRDVEPLAAISDSRGSNN